MIHAHSPIPSAFISIAKNPGVPGLFFPHIAQAPRSRSIEESYTLADLWDIVRVMSTEIAPFEINKLGPSPTLFETNQI